MRRHIANAGWGVLDYAAYPAMMFVVAPVVLHRLGAAEYGIWSVTTAVISIGGVIASGFGDASIQRVARLRGAGSLGCREGHDGADRTQFAEPSSCAGCAAGFDCLVCRSGNGGAAGACTAGADAGVRGCTEDCERAHTTACARDGSSEHATGV